LEILDAFLLRFVVSPINYTHICRMW